MTHPTDADVEAMARAIFSTHQSGMKQRGFISTTWEKIDTAETKAMWLKDARAALMALPHYLRAVEEREGLIEALEALVADVLEYERINNLAPNPGRRDCWQSVTNARAALAKVGETE